MFRTSVTRLTVPAGGTAEVAATVDTRVDAVDGYFSGTWSPPLVSSARWYRSGCTVRWRATT
ncbi:hypothetical protein D2L64_20465 [Micromonospora radicis]|uniref:Uncharacterized protein n=1 Tax=Micromonospora radicis TaxID=1894971 RepID=A0A418MQI6_9ACTN|nr:hypothetical protein D2L64_20465 [Micromonospora radicis]